MFKPRKEDATRDFKKQFDLAKKHYQKRNKPEPEEGQDVLHGSCWYQLTPTKIELINETLFGFEKQKLTL